MLKSQAIWYVYELIDPRNGQVFYVGKGKGDRINSHETDAKTGYPSFKCNKIRSIWADGHQIVKQKVATFWDEDAAYECEEARIQEIGLNALTNVMGGGRRKEVPYRIPEKVKAKRPTTVAPMEACWKIVRMFPSWLAIWLKRPNPDSKLHIKDGMPLLQRVLVESLVNVILPIAWKRIISDPTNHAKLQELLQPWNITLTFEPNTVEV